MSVRQIRRKYNTITKKIDILMQELQDLQTECPHNHVESKAGSNTGNYDPTANSYWTDFHCPDCEKKWTVQK